MSENFPESQIRPAPTGVPPAFSFFLSPQRVLCKHNFLKNLYKEFLMRKRCFDFGNKIDLFFGLATTIFLKTYHKILCLAKNSLIYKQELIGEF